MPNPCLNPGLSKSYSLGGVERNFSGTGDHDACTAKIVASLLHMGYECLQVRTYLPPSRHTMPPHRPQIPI